MVLARVLQRNVGAPLNSIHFANTTPTSKCKWTIKSWDFITNWQHILTVEKWLEAAESRELEDEVKTIFDADAQQFRNIGVGHVADNAQLNQEISFFLCRSVTPAVFLHCYQLSVFEHASEHLRIPTLAH